MPRRIPKPTSVAEFQNNLIVHTDHPIFQLHPHGELLATDAPGEIHLWNMHAKRVRTIESASTNQPLKIATWKSYLLVCHQDGLVRFWDAKGNNVKNAFLAENHDWLSYFSTDDEGHFISASWQANLSFWNILEDVKMVEQPKSELAKSSSSVSSDQDCGLASSQEPEANAPETRHIENRILTEAITCMHGHNTITSLVQFEGNFWTATNHKIIHVWNETGCFKELRGHRGDVNTLCEWNGHIASGSADGDIRVWNSQFTNVLTLSGHKSAVNKLVVWQGRLCSAGGDEAIRVWSFDGRCIGILQGHSKSVTSLCVWKDKLWSSSWDHTLRSWKVNWPWKLGRVLWIGWKKNKPADCPVAKLPKDILKYIIALLEAENEFAVVPLQISVPKGRK